MSESKKTWDKWAAAAQKLREHLNKAGLKTVDKPRTLKERRAEADAAPAPKLKNGVYR